MAWRFSSPFLRGVREDNLVRPALPPPEILIECNFAKEPGREADISHARWGWQVLNEESGTARKERSGWWRGSYRDPRIIWQVFMNFSYWKSSINVTFGLYDTFANPQKDVILSGEHCKYNGQQIRKRTKSCQNNLWMVAYALLQFLEDIKTLNMKLIWLTFFAIVGINKRSYPYSSHKSGNDCRMLNISPSTLDIILQCTVNSSNFRSN